MVLVAAGGPDTLFEEAFGRRAVERTETATVQFEIDGQPIGTTSVLTSRGAAPQQLRVLADPVLKALAPRLQLREALARLNALWDSAVGTRPRHLGEKITI